MTYPDESMYKGSWKHEKKNGYGEFYFSDLKVYRGQWIDDLQDG